MPRLNIQKAIQQGYTEEEIKQFANTRGIELYGGTASAEQIQPDERGNILTNSLPLVGAVGGGILGGVVGGGLPGLIAGSAIGGGLGKAGENFLEEGTVNPQEVGKEALISGAFGVAGAGAGKALRPVLSKLGGGLFRGGTIASKSTLKTASQQQQLLDASRKYLGSQGTGKIVGKSAAGKFQKVESVIDDLTNQVDDLYKGSVTTTSTQSLDDIANGLTRTMDTPAEQRAFKSLYDKAFRSAFGKARPENLTAGDVNKLRRVFNKQAKAAFRSVEAGGVLSRPNQAVLDLIEFTDDAIADLAPASTREAVRGLNKEASILIRGIPELQKASEQGLHIFGANIQSPTRALQAASDTLGRGGLTAGGSDITGNVAGQVGGRVLLGGEQPPVPGQDQQQTLPGQGQQADVFATGNLPGAQPQIQPPQQGATPGQGNLAAQQREYFNQMVVKDLAQTGGKNVSKIIAAAKFMLPEEDGGGAATISDKFFDLADNTIENIKTGEAMKDPFTGEMIGGTDVRGYGPVRGRTYEASIAYGGGAGIPQEAVALNQKYNILKLNILRAFQGARISDKDFDLAARYIPSITDTPATAKTKVQILETLLIGARNAGGVDTESEGFETLTGDYLQ